MSKLTDIIARIRGSRAPGSNPDPDPEYTRQKKRAILKAAVGGRAPPFKNYVNYAAFPDRDPGTTGTETHDKVIRRAVHYTNAQLGIQGLVRTDFDKELNDRLAQNAVYSLCEKGVMDYFGTADWEIVNEKGEQQTEAMKALRRPNPHQTFQMVLKETVRDTTRYDAGVMVCSLTADGYLGELRAYHGPDFWIEVDRDWSPLEGIGSQYYGPWSHGVVKRYWQHSRPGIYIPFDPKEICYFMLYPRTDSMYGTDFLSRLRWQLEYLIDSTRAAGMTFANGIMPGAIWKHPDYTSIEELAERELDIELNHLGADRFGGIIHLIGNESIESFSPTLHDLEWIEGQKFFTDIVLAMFGFSPSEFFQSDINRATAYIGRNITKSRMLYPLQVHFENMITAKVLPLMEGWDDDWEFRFIDTVDLDDELKRAQINQTRAATASSYAMLGLSVEAALELAEVDDDLRTAVKEDLDALKEQEGNWTEGLPEELPRDEAAQYYGDAGGEDYLGTAVDGDDAENREDYTDVQKAERVYLRPGEKPPAGVQVKTGPRGGRYYETRAGSEPEPQPPGPSAGPERRPTTDIPYWTKEAPDPIPWKEGERERFISALESRQPEAIEQFAKYEGMGIGPGIKAPSPNPGEPPIPLPPDAVLGRVYPGTPLQLMTWETYRYFKASEAAARTPQPPRTKDVDRWITRRGRKDWNKDREVGTVYDHEGSIIYRKKGYSHSILFSDEELQYLPGNCLIHTHPSGNGFSTQDIAFACRAGLSEIRAIGPEWEYIMQPPEGMSRFTIGLYVGRIKDLVDRTENEIRDELWPKIIKGEISSEQAEYVHVDTLWRRVAEATGIRYYRRPADPDRWTEDQYLSTEEEEKTS